MTTENRRLLIAIDAEIREINRQTIHGVFPEITLSDLTPVITMVAQARAAYLRALYDTALKAAGTCPTREDVADLERLRHVYEELVKGSQALETAIEREYLDVRK